MPLTVSHNSSEFYARCFGDLGLRCFTTFVSSDVDGRQCSFRLEEHIERVTKTSEVLGNSAYKKEVLTQEVRTEVARYCTEKPVESSSLIIKLLLGKSAELLIDAYKSPWGDSVSAVPVSFERALPEYKTTSAAPCILARKAALAEGADEGILIDREGDVREGAWSNLFWIDQSGKIFTPYRRVLPGITRRVVQELVGAEEREISLKELLTAASELFITQSTTGVTPLHSFAGKQFSIKQGLEIRARYVKVVERESVPWE